MYKICTYCLSKAHLSVLKVSLCIYRVWLFSVLFAWFFLRVHLAIFAYDYLATLVCVVIVVIKRQHQTNISKIDNCCFGDKSDVDWGQTLVFVSHISYPFRMKTI